jgi:hypothetical protein
VAGGLWDAAHAHGQSSDSGLPGQTVGRKETTAPHRLFPRLAPQVNAEVLRCANAAAAAAAPGALFLLAEGGAAPLSSATGLAGAARPVGALQAAFRPQDPASAGAAAWAALAGDGGAGPALRRAYAHAGGCRCDVTAEMRALGDG